MPNQYINERVVVDTDTKYTYIGLLTHVDERSITLEDVAIYDSAIIRISLEEYLIECASLGYDATRKSLWIRSHKVVSVSRLRDIVVP